MDTMACIFGVCIITNFMLNVWWRFLTVNLQYTCYFLDLFQTWTISCQIWLILFRSIAINNNNLHTNVQCNSNQSNENLPLTCKTSENNEWFLCFVFCIEIWLSKFFTLGTGLWYCYQLGRRAASCKEMWGMWVNNIMFLVLVNITMLFKCLWKSLRKQMKTA